MAVSIQVISHVKGKKLWVAHCVRDSNIGVKPSVSIQVISHVKGKQPPGQELDIAWSRDVSIQVISHVKGKRGPERASES
jgi:hypothetical protein